MSRFRDLFPTTPSERIAMSACYGLVFLGAWMILHPYAAGAAITKAVMDVVGVFA